MQRLSVSVAGLVMALACPAASAQPAGAGGYLVLDGVDDSVTARGDFLLQTLTIEAWVYPTSLHPQWTAGIVSYGGASNSSFDFGIGAAGDARVRFFINWNQGHQSLVGTTPVTMNTWQHLAVTYDGETARIYVNGQPDGQKAFNAPILPPTPEALLAIGDDYPGASEFIGGRFDEIRIWSVVRTQAEIQGAMGAPLQGDEPGLFAYYTFDEVAGQLALDKSRSGLHGRLGLSPTTEDGDPVRARYQPTRLRGLRVSSSDAAELLPITGTVAQQLATINAGPPTSGWTELLNRHADLHQRDSFACGQNLSRPYVDSSGYLGGADEITLDNCGSAFYRVGFALPPVLGEASVLGWANADDLGVAFVNRRPISLLLTDQDVSNLGHDRIVTRHHLLGWPTPDPIFEDEVPDLLRPGPNTITLGVCSDASSSEPAGAEFDVIIQYECIADWNADGEHNTADFTAFLNDWTPRDDPETDLNGDGQVNTQDVSLYINLWLFGCPE